MNLSSSFVGLKLNINLKLTEKRPAHKDDGSLVLLAPDWFSSSSQTFKLQLELGKSMQKTAATNHETMIYHLRHA